jgi:hypothetical protein
MKAAVVEFKAFIGTERERYDARKQSMAKTERTRQFAELVKFGQSFKVCAQQDHTDFRSHIPCRRTFCPF